MSNPKRLLIAILLILLASGVLALLFGQRIDAALPADNAQIQDSLRQFTQVYNLVEKNYAEPVSPDKAIYDGAIPGMLRVLDPHSTFFDPKAFAQLNEEQTGKYYGVGMEIGPRGNQIVVISPFVGSPAYRAGIRAGDVITSIDGKSTDNMTTADVADMVKGPRGTKVHITLLREGSQPLEFNVVRDEIPRHSVDVHFLLKPGIGYIHISSFIETTDHELEQALNSFGNLNGLVLDLRQDPGGLLKEAVSVAGKFLPKGAVVVSQKGRSSPDVVYRAKGEDHGGEYPIVVLVNRGTASAAEIVSGAIQDHDRGLIAGENTFGKGLVQTVYPLSDQTGLALTTAKYYTPSGRLIQRNYNGVSLYDYYYGADKPLDSTAPREVKTTDSGRTVYGGDGITPDVKIPDPKPNHFQNELLVHYVFFDFARRYVTQHQVTPNFTVDDQVLQDFRNFLNEQKVPWIEADFAQNLDWVKTNIKSEIFIDQFGVDAGMKAKAEADPEVMKALDLLPQAKQLTENARRIMAARAGGPSR